jgi:hypothetical protein
MLKSVACSMAGICICCPAVAQQISRLDCQGAFYGTPAVISGDRQFTPTSAVGEGYVRFQGSIAAGGMEGRITYEGYTATAPFSGVISGPRGTIAVGVLDNTDGRMAIYSGTPSLGPPDELGEFVCNWRSE